MPKNIKEKIIMEVQTFIFEKNTEFGAFTLYNHLSHKQKKLFSKNRRIIKIAHFKIGIVTKLETK